MVDHTYCYPPERYADDISNMSNDAVCTFIDTTLFILEFSHTLNVIQIVKFHIGMIQPNNRSKLIPLTLLLDEVSEKTYGTYLQIYVDPDVIL